MVFSAIMALSGQAVFAQARIGGEFASPAVNHAEQGSGRVVLARKGGSRGPGGSGGAGVPGGGGSGGAGLAAVNAGFVFLVRGHTLYEYLPDFSAAVHQVDLPAATTSGSTGSSTSATAGYVHPTSIAANTAFVFVLANSTLYEYDTATLTLVTQVSIPSSTASTTGSTGSSPGACAALSANDTLVFAFAGTTVYEFQTGSLTVSATITLPTV